MDYIEANHLDSDSQKSSLFAWSDCNMLDGYNMRKNFNYTSDNFP